MYVWLDALTNYITGVGYPNRDDTWERYWPADLHLIGKDVVRFHAVYWPAFLMSAGLPLPRCVYGHGHVLLRGEKMSKSAGNVVDPLEMAQRFGTDSLRYFLMREISFGQDGSYSEEAIVTRANAELANSFGNLAQRAFSMIYKNLEGVVPPAGKAVEDAALLGRVNDAIACMVAEFDELNFSTGLEAWMAAVFACNAYVDAMAPWTLRKTNSARMAEVLGTLAVAVKLLAQAVRPVVPSSAEKLLAYIEDGQQSGRISPPSPIFPRLELGLENAVAGEGSAA
jgi:methionyl-tRNA synthetase